MARSTALGKRKARDSETPAVPVKARKTRSTTTARKVLVRVEVPSLPAEAENDENAAPEEIEEPVAHGDDIQHGILEEISTLSREIGDNDTPSRRAEKRGRKVAFATSTIDAHFAVSKAGTKSNGNGTLLKELKSTLKTISPAKNEAATAPRTPRTPRYKDALAATPKHQVRVVGRLPLTPKTPRTPNGSAITVYNAARQLFARGADGKGLVGREKERGEIKSFIEEGLKSRSGRSLYISGPPGTGKSAFTNSVSEAFKDIEGVRCAYVNCMSVRNTQDLHAQLLDGLCQGEQEKEEDMEQSLRTMFFPKDKEDDFMFLITLDEIDHLLTLNLETLYTLFEWALDPASNLILIGIANALDLTDRFLPRLKAKNLRPQLLPFIPYSVSEVTAVITSRLQSLLPADAPDKKFVPFVQAPAIQLCAKKVASQTGDLRKAFDIIRRAIDFVENDVKAKHASNPSPSPSANRGVLTENKNLAALSPLAPPPTTSRPSASLSQLTALTAPRASLAHLAKVTASAFNNGTSTRLKTLNLQQKATLCAIIAHTNKSSQSKLPFTPTTTNRTPLTTPKKIRTFGKPEPAPTVKKLYETYSSLCKRDGALAPLTSTEFADVVASLEGLGLVVEEKSVLATPRKSKGLNVGREDKRVRGCVSEQEIEGCLEGAAGALLRGLLKGHD